MTEWLTWIGAGGGAGAVGKGIFDMLRARSDVRKTNADAAQVIVNTAATSNAEYAKDLFEVKAELRKVEQTQRRQEKLLSAHHRWDEEVVDQLRALGREIADPPPLYLEGT